MSYPECGTGVTDCLVGKLAADIVNRLTEGSGAISEGNESGDACLATSAAYEKGGAGKA